MPHRPRPRAFTIVELMVVIVIIGLLVGISLVLGKKVTQGAKLTATRNTLQLCEQVLTQYKAAQGGKVPAYYQAYLSGNGSKTKFAFPIIDARAARLSDTANSDRKNDYSTREYAAPAEPSLALFLAMASEQVPGVRETIGKIDKRFLASDEKIETAWGVPASDAQGAKPLRGYSVLDGWGNPLRLVLPEFQGGYAPAGSLPSGSVVGKSLKVTGGDALELDMRRLARPQNTPASGDVGDADQGQCVAGAPYIYSAGPDGDPGTIDDNVYGVNRPNFPAELQSKQLPSN